MFSIGIFGTGDKEKDVGDVVLDQCPNCPDTPTGHVVTRYHYFHVFFIPVYRWGQEYAVYCPDCRTWFHVAPELGRQIETGELRRLNYWQLKNRAMHQEPPFCPHCGAQLEDHFTFCPHCGQRRE